MLNFCSQTLRGLQIGLWYGLCSSLVWEFSGWNDHINRFDSEILAFQTDVQGKPNRRRNQSIGPESGHQTFPI